MLNIRTIILSVLLAFTLIFTVGKAVAATVVKPSADIVSRSLDAKTGLLECASLPARSSIHTVYVEEIGMRVSYTEDGPTGVDGGLMNLLSAYRTCS
jgi:hypothetical protein